MPQQNNKKMNKNCFYCGHTMFKTKSKTEIRNGVAYILTEYTCTNPECGATTVYDKPYDE